MPYQPEERTRAIAAYRRTGSLRKAADETGVPHSTIHSWVRDPEQEGIDFSPDPLDDEEALRVEHQSDIEREADERNSTTDDTYAEGVHKDEGTTPAGLLDDLADPLYLGAFRRYVTGLANGSHPMWAMHAARRVHPAFDLSPELDARVQSAAGRILASEDGYERLVFADPPQYVHRIVDDYGMGPKEVDDLADRLYALKLDAYKEGINSTLVANDAAPISAITDPTVHDQVRQDAEASARGIAETWNRDAASQAGAAWLEVQPGAAPVMQEGGYLAIPSPAEREQTVREAMDGWLDGRQDWKPEQWAITEVASSFNDGVQDFVSRNDLTSTARGYVTPESAQCSGCAELVALGEQPMDVWGGTDVSLHPGCVHSLVVIAEEIPAEPWTAQADAGALSQTG